MEPPRTLMPHPPVIKAVVCIAKHGSSLVLGGGLRLDGQDLEWALGRRPTSLSLPASISGFGHSCLPMHGNPGKPCHLWALNNCLSRSPNLSDPEKGCNLPGVTQHSSTHTGPAWLWSWGLPPKILGGASASCLLAWGWTCSGPQANATIWEKSLLESQVAELPATKPFWRTERAHEGGVLPAARPAGHPFPGTKAAEPPAHSGCWSKKDRARCSSSTEWLLTEPLCLGTVTSSLSKLPPWTPRPEPPTQEVLVWLIHRPTPVSFLLRLPATREHWVPSLRRGNSLCKTGWPQTPEVPPASASLVLGFGLRFILVLALCIAYRSSQARKKVASGPLELESQMVESCYVGAGT
jgi:hypothetical protein